MSDRELRSWAEETLGFYLSVNATKESMLERLARLAV